jgi:hypothetical protein
MQMYLTSDEQRHFASLPADIRDGVIVTDESSQGFERAQELRIRAHIARFPDDPEMKKVKNHVAMLAIGRMPDLSTISDSAMEDFLFTIGAKGITLLIKLHFQKGTFTTAGDISLLATLTDVRHDILLANAA